MGSKMISVRDDIYNTLDRMKQEGESFSDVILRLIASEKRNPLQHFGIGKDIPKPINDIFEEGIEIARKANLQSRKRHQEALEKEIH